MILDAFDTEVCESGEEMLVVSFLFFWGLFALLTVVVGKLLVCCNSELRLRRGL